MDGARDWIDQLEWDGEDRISKMPYILGIKSTPYNLEVMRYLFSGVAGRVIKPGDKLDMAPVLVGPQGCRKSTFVEMLAPFDRSFATHDFSLKDSDAARRLRGKVVVELDEMRGLSTREEESIKAWLTRREEEHVPKYMEHSKAYLRRFICIGTTNHEKFLSDTTGNRRYLPIRVCTEKKAIDTEWVSKNIQQLWAQGKSIYQKEGIRWWKAEELAKAELSKYTKTSASEQAIRRFLKDAPDEPLTSALILSGAFGQGLGHHKAEKNINIIERTMPALGYRWEAGVWIDPII